MSSFSFFERRFPFTKCMMNGARDPSVSLSAIYSSCLPENSERLMVVVKLCVHRLRSR